MLQNTEPAYTKNEDRAIICGFYFLSLLNVPDTAVASKKQDDKTLATKTRHLNTEDQDQYHIKTKAECLRSRLL